MITIIQNLEWLGFKDLFLPVANQHGLGEEVLGIIYEYYSDETLDYDFLVSSLEGIIDSTADEFLGNLSEYRLEELRENEVELSTPEDIEEYLQQYHSGYFGSYRDVNDILHFVFID